MDLLNYQKSLQELTAANHFSSAECLAVLYYSDTDTLKEKALLAYLSKIKTNTDALQLLPFLSHRDVAIFVANILKSYFKYNNLTKKEWKASITNWVKVMNSPHPTVTFFITDILTQQKIPLEYKNNVLQNGSTTIKEILAGKSKDIIFYKQKIYPFLTYLTEKNFANNWNKWSDYLQNYNHIL